MRACPAYPLLSLSLPDCHNQYTLPMRQQQLVLFRRWDTTSCCNDPDVDLIAIGGGEIYNGSAWVAGYTLVPVALLQTSSPTSSGSARSNPAPTSTASRGLNDTTSDATCRRDDDSDEKAQKVGLQVGLGVGLPLLAAIAGLGFLLWREKRANRGSPLAPLNSRLLSDGGMYGYKKPAEMSAVEEFREMPTGIEAPELHHDRIRR